MTKLELLKKVTGENFEEIICNGKVNEYYYKSKNGEAFMIEKEESSDYIEQAILNEIPYMDNVFLKDNLPEKFHNEDILNDLKELAKFDNTVISDHINYKPEFYIGAVSKYGYNYFYLPDSTRHEDENYEIYYSKN